MKNITNIILMSFCILILFFFHAAKAQDIDNKEYNMSSMKDKGVPASKDYFTGTVRVNMVVNPDDNYNMVLGKVNFEAKARTNWHTHTVGQILILTDGVGYYQEKGKLVKVIREGDVVKIPKDVEHWHGASHYSAMIHTAIVPSAEAGSTTWLKPVTDEEYDSCISVLSQPANIKLTDAAVKNHEELWPGYTSQAKQTDPELIEVFDNFAFDEVFSHGNLDVKTKTMMILASTIASQSLTEYKMFLNAALNAGVTPIEVKEILYQSVPYVGIAKTVDFIYLTNEIFTERGIELPLEGQSTTTPETRYEKGMALQKSIFGERIDNAYKSSPEDQLHIQKYLSANCFGDYYTRNGLDIKTRELLTFSMLIALGGAESQLKGHIQGNINIGNDKEKLLNMITQLLPYVGYPRTLNALRCLNETALTKID